MWLIMKVFLLQILAFLVFGGGIHCQASTRRLTFVVREASYKRLCSTKNILTVNGKFPGPTIYATKGETIIVDVYNKGNENITIHWHGVTMPRYPWTDGPEYITQCPIRPGSKFTQKIILSTEEGTLWWHAHSDWTRATVHGAIIIYPKNGTKYPFPKPDREVPIILGEWWKNDVNAVRDEGLQPELNAKKEEYSYEDDTFKLTVDHGKTYLLRIINAALQEALFFSIDKHKMTVVGTDGSYTKPLTRDFITIFLAKPMIYCTYSGYYTPSSPPSLPYLPAYNDTNASVQVMAGLRSLANAEHPCNVPLSTSTNLIYTVSVNSYPCVNNSCAGANGTRFSSMPSSGTEVRVLEYNSTVEIVFQGTNVLAATHHPMHLHGYSFYVVGWGFGNFDEIRTLCAIIWWILPSEYHLCSSKWLGCNQIRGIQPWSVVHALPCRTPSTWGMETAFIVKNGKHPEAQMCLLRRTCHHVEAAKK
ncbi:putative laccase-9 [Vitis vinifera]|uniref:Putative laccase-9 n=1 Tax=Vitis vinifera TaxID=29760 RepID=A0A438ECE5_VITVI|nr:putative laccase-9 [Vitis vinifera]